MTVSPSNWSPQVPAHITALSSGDADYTVVSLVGQPAPFFISLKCRCPCRVTH